MVRLSREIRFALVPVGHINDLKHANSWAGWPSTEQIVPQLALRCVVAGEPDPTSGYVCNIKLLDDLLRKIVVEEIIPQNDGRLTCEWLIRTVTQHVGDLWNHGPTVESVTLVVSPYLNYRILARNPNMIEITQQFEFSAAHRLHCPDYSDDKNMELFGKCNNPKGHGHNYVVEVTLARELDPEDLSGQVVAMQTFETTVKQQVIDKLDHKHLNEDVKRFKNVNPTVENIASLLFDWLDGKFDPAVLQKIRVYETPKTWAEVRRED